MANRGGNSRGRARGRGGHISQRQRNESIQSRLGAIPTYQRNDRIPTKKDKYKFVKKDVIINSVATLPPDTKVKQVTKDFIKSYYEIFDRPGRPNLQDQYNDNAFFTFSTLDPVQPPSARNLLLISGEERIKRLYFGKQIPELLTAFPQTKHATDSFSYDTPFYQAHPLYISSMHIIITGTFEDLSSSAGELRAFTRTFIIERTPTQAQQDKWRAQRIANLSPIQQEMVVKLMARTELNRAGSEKLLNETEWNIDKALEIYNQLGPSGSIPPEMLR